MVSVLCSERVVCAAKKVEGDTVGTPQGILSNKIFMHIAFVLAPRMRRFERSRPVSQRELEDIANNLTSDSVIEYDIDCNSDNDPDDFPHENISECEDDLEIESEKSSDEEVEDNEVSNVQSVVPKYIAKYGME